MSESLDEASSSEETKLYSTFYLGDRLFGIDVGHVQEITKSLPLSTVPLSPNFVHGIINLRGQISTAIGLRELLGLSGATPDDSMNVVCNLDGSLVSFVVDRVGDVIEVKSSDFEPPPDTVPGDVKKFMSGVYKLSDQLLSILQTKSILGVLNS